MAARSIPKDSLVAARRWGHLVDRVAARYTNPVTGKPLSGVALLLKVGSGETGFDPQRVSSAGARGETQFIPGTRADYLHKFGVDPWRSKDEAYHATALYLKHDPRGLAGYNPGMPDYTGYILGQRIGPVGGGGSPGTTRAPRVPGAGGGAGPVGLLGDPGGAAGQATDVLAGLLSQRQGPPISSPAPPAFAAQAALPQGYQPISGGAPASKPGIDQLLSLVQAPAAAATAGVTGAAPAAAASRGRTVSAPSARGGLSFPLARRGRIIGVPYQGTHTQFGNWQSDNAVDISTPKGTPVVAVADGRIGSRIGPLGSSSSQLAGQRVYVEGKGNQWYYAHLSRIVVKPGQRVRKGQVIGYSGVANGVPHLHIASQHGSPLKQFGR